MSSWLRPTLTVALLSAFAAAYAQSPEALAEPNSTEQRNAAQEARASLADLDASLARAIEDWNIPGAAIAVVAGGEKVLSTAAGFRDLDRKLPMTPDTLFPVGSTTKAFTTTLLGMLVDDGAFDWDAPLLDVLPEFRLADPVTTQLITPRDLVTHRSGLPRHDLLWYNNNESTRAELVARLAHVEASEKLRARYQYNNLMYLTAGFLVERLTGGSWEQAVESRLLAPLGMERTNLSVAESQRDDDFAWPYRENDEDEIERIPFRPIDLIGPAGSINSSVNEMSRWLRFNLGGGEVAGRRLINATTLADIQSPHMVMGEAPDRPEVTQVGYGLGWEIDSYRGHRRLHHGGGIDGFTTSVMLFPDAGVGLVSFTNRGSGLPFRLNQHVADLALGLAPTGWLAEALKDRQAGRVLLKQGREKKATTRRAGTVASHPLGDYAGDYHHPGYGLLEVRLAGEALSVRFNAIEAPLEHWHYDVWNGAETAGDPTFEDVKFQFRADLEGNIAAVEAPLEPRVDSIVFRKRPDERLADPEHLRRLAGIYELPGQQATFTLSGNHLTLTLTGQPTYTLNPDLSGRFVLEELSVVSIAFEEDSEGRITGATFHQPNGVFTATRKE